MTHRAIRQLLLLTLAAAFFAGCSTLPDKQTIDELAAIPYPKSATVGEDLDIVVTQHWNNVIRLNNRSASTLRNGQLWLNQQYALKFSEIRIGEADGNTFDLHRFIANTRQPYPTAGFFSPDKAYPVVLAEVFDPATGKRHKLVVRRKPGR